VKEDSEMNVKKFLAVFLLVVLTGVTAGCHELSSDDHDDYAYRDGYRDGRAHERRREDRRDSRYHERRDRYRRRW
jgi:hypothetical protein